MRHYHSDRDAYLRKQRDRQERNRDKCRAASAGWRARNPGAVSEYNRAYKAEHREALADYDRRRRAANPEQQRDQHRAWVSKNRGLKNALTAARMEHVRRATPPWLTDADWATIRALYVRAAELTRQTGIKHHVDHIVPLRGETVSGLHAPGNLRVITASENSRKRNKFVPELAAAEIASGERIAVSTGTGINPNPNE